MRQCNHCHGTGYITRLVVPEYLVFDTELSGDGVTDVYPATLHALTQAQGQYGPWRKSIPLDPWGTPYQYEARQGIGFIVYSTGPDRTSSSSITGGLGGDDIGFIGK